VLTVAQAAKRLALSPSKVYRLVAARRIPHHRFDGAIRFSESDLEEYLESTKERERDTIPAKRKQSRPRLRHLT
jgi:excisionase family DNA binding protein